MKHTVIAVGLLIAGVLCCVPSGMAADSQSVIEELANGHINWSAGLIVATGANTPVKKQDGNEAMNRQLAIDSARKAAQKNLLAVMQHIRVKSGIRAGDLAETNPLIRHKMVEMVRLAPVVKQDFLSDGTVQITLQMSMYGGFAQLILPDEIQQIETIKAVAKPVQKSVAAEDPASGEKSVYSGLVVDARGINAQAVMVPVILNENGEEMYGAAYASREFAVQEGMCTYSRNLESAMADKRIADAPLLVKGIRIVSPGSTDIVISNSDAAKIRSASEHLEFLKKCRVVVVLD